jgi:hypothetical protein
MLQIIPWEYNLIFIEEIELFTFLLSQKPGCSNSFISITHLERSYVMILSIKQITMNINDNRHHSAPYMLSESKRNRRYFVSNINNMVLQTISTEGNYDFHRRNRHIDIWTFSKTWMFELVRLNHIFGTTMTHDGLASETQTVAKITDDNPVWDVKSIRWIWTSETRDEKSAVQAALIDQRQSNGTVAKMCSPWIRKNSKTLSFKC